MTGRSGTQTSKQNKQQKRPQQAQQQAARPKPTPSEAQAQATQEAARREGRMQRQTQARAEAERRRRAGKVRTYGIISLVVVAVVAVIGWFVIREAGKPGQPVSVMADRTHLANPTDPHAAYTSDPPTSGPHTQAVPQFKVYTNQADLPVTMQVHGLEDGGVVVNYKPDLDKPTVDKLTSLAQLYENTPGKEHLILSPYQGLSNSIVLTSWGRMERLDAYDEPTIRTFIDAYVNVDHHEGSEGNRLP